MNYLSLYRQEDGRVLIKDIMNYSFAAEVTDDGNGVITDKFRAIDASSGYPNHEMSYHVFRAVHDENGNWIGGENSDLYFNDSNGVRHVVASRADLEADHVFGNPAHAESMGNGNYLIAYTVKDTQDSYSTDIYYRIFDSELGSFTGGSTYLGSVSDTDYLSLYRQEDGRVLIKDIMNYSFAAEVTDDGNGVITDKFRAIDASSGYPNHEMSYHVFRAVHDENGNWIGEENSDLYFNDSNGVRHVVASRADLEADHVFGYNALAESMGNGNYLIAYSVRESQGGHNDIYYRIFDSELGSFTGGSTYLGSVSDTHAWDYLSLYRQEDGRVLIKDTMNYSFSAEVTDDGNGIIGDSAEELLTLSFDLGGLASDQEYENAIKIDDSVADLDIFGFNYVIGDTVSNVSNFDYDDGNLGVDQGKIESDFSLVYGSRWSDWIEGSAADQSFVTFGGNDRIYAGEGFDTVIFEGDASEFTYELSPEYSNEPVDSSSRVGIATDDTRTKVVWNSPDDPNIQVVLSDQSATYPSLGMEFSNDGLSNNGRSAVSELGNGDFVAVYSRYSSSVGDYELMARVFDPSTGTTKGNELTLASPSNGGFHYLKIFPLVDLISPFSSSMASIMTRHTMQLIKMAKWLNFLVFNLTQRTRVGYCGGPLRIQMSRWF